MIQFCIISFIFSLSLVIGQHSHFYPVSKLTKLTASQPNWVEITLEYSYCIYNVTTHFGGGLKQTFNCSEDECRCDGHNCEDLSLNVSLIGSHHNLSVFYSDSDCVIGDTLLLAIGRKSLVQDSVGDFDIVGGGYPGEVLKIISIEKSSLNPAKYAIDSDKNTYSMSTAKLGERMWLEVKLEQIFCISHIIVDLGSRSSHWSCTGNRHCKALPITNLQSNYSSAYSTDCPQYYLEVSTDNPGADVGSSSGSSRLGCSYGDTIKLSRLRKIGCGDNIIVYDIEIMVNLGKFRKFITVQRTNRLQFNSVVTVNNVYDQLYIVLIFLLLRCWR